MSRYIVKLLALLAVGTIALTAPADIWYVDNDAPAGGDGTSWAQAFRYLQDALALASAGDEVRIAHGTYHPDQRSDWPAGGSGDRDVAFELIPDVKLFGGYAGTDATDPDERDTHAFQTTLSGDLNENDTGPFEGNADNSRRIVYAVGNVGSAELDGLTITAAASFANESAHSGGLVCVEGASPTIFDCRVIENYKYGDSWTNAGGAGVYARDSSPHFRQCAISGNRSGQFGGGVFSRGGDPHFYKCAIESNFSERRGGGLYCAGQVSLRNCTISENEARERGAGGDFADYARIEDCTISNNSIEGIGDAGGLYITSGKLIRCSISANRSDEDAGGMWTVGDVELWYCTITDNFSCCGLGGLKCEGGRVQLFGCVVAGNPGYEGFAGLCAYDCDMLVSNCTIINNPSHDGGDNAAGIKLRRSTVAIANSILRGNSESADVPQISVARGTVSISYSNIAGSRDSITVESGELDWGAGNIDADPIFVDPDENDYHLQLGSPCIDAGNPDFEPHENDFDPDGMETDLDSQPRVWPARVDMGADEVYDCNGNGVPDDQDLADGTLTDADNDGVPDECAATDDPTDGGDDGSDADEGNGDSEPEDDTSDQDTPPTDGAADPAAPRCGPAPCGPGLLGWLPLSLCGLVTLKQNRRRRREIR